MVGMFVLGNTDLAARKSIETIKGFFGGDWASGGGVFSTFLR